MSSPKIRRTQTGFRKPGQIDGIKRAMLDGTFEFEEKRIGGWLDSKGTYYIGEGHHRMAAIQEIYKKTGDPKYINRLINDGQWTKTISPPVDARLMPSRDFFGKLRNKLRF